MFSHEVFVSKVCTIYAFASGPIPFDEVSTLNHESFDDPVEHAVFVANGEMVFTVFARAELPASDGTAGVTSIVSQSLPLDGTRSILALRSHVRNLLVSSFPQQRSLT